MSQQPVVIISQRSEERGTWGRTCAGSFFLSLLLGPIFGVCNLFCSKTPRAQFGTFIGTGTGTIIIAIILLGPARSSVTNLCNSTCVYYKSVYSYSYYYECMSRCTFYDVMGIVGGILLAIALLCYVVALVIFARNREDFKNEQPKMSAINVAPTQPTSLAHVTVPMTPSLDSKSTVFHPNVSTNVTTTPRKQDFNSEYPLVPSASQQQQQMAPNAPPEYSGGYGMKKFDSLSTLAVKLDLPILMDLAEKGITSEELQQVSVSDAQSKYGISKTDFFKLKKYFVSLS